MKTLNEHDFAFNLSLPSYSEIQKTISRMKSSGSLCPIDHISVLVLKTVQYSEHSYGEYVASVGKTNISLTNGRMLPQFSCIKKVQQLTQVTPYQ